MRRLLALVALAFAGMVLSLSTGCATYVAMKMPGPSRDKEVAIGMHRQEIERVLGVGSSSQYDNSGMTVVRYEYADGPPQGSKVRGVLYVAADVFSAFLSELIFWPIELYADKKIKRVGTAEYDTNNLLAAWKINRLGGDVLKQEGSPLPDVQDQVGMQEPSTPKVDPK